jgi:hypothetical protein
LEALLLGTRFQSFCVGLAVYHVGELPLRIMLEVWVLASIMAGGAHCAGIRLPLAIWAPQWRGAG